MEDEPCTSMESQRGKQLPENSKIKSLKKISKGGGGTSCCVPNCDSNSRKNPELSFHKFPKDPKLRKTWIHWVSRADFKPSEHHKVCSKYFEGGKKTYLGNIPTVVPKLIKPTPSKPRPTYKCRVRKDIHVDAIHKSTRPSKKMQSKIHKLEEEIEMLKQQKKQQEVDILALREKVEQQTFSAARFKNSDTDFELYTGFPNYSTFKALYDYLCPACERLKYIGANNSSQAQTREKCGRKRALSPEDELFLCLSRLRCGLLERDLENRFNISVTQVSRIWITWLDFLHQRLRSIPIWPTQNYVRANMPASFKESYPNTRVIIDCTELFLEMPSQPRTQSATFSSYKHHNTAKGLVGISPKGDLTFVSELYAGNTSDKQLTNDCGILNLSEPGDEVMADRGFSIENDLPAGVSLNLPPFLNDQKQFSEDEIKTRQIAKHRIHVERAIKRIKTFRILQNTLPISTAADINKIWVVCSYLTLFFKPLLRDHEE